MLITTVNSGKGDDDRENINDDDDDDDDDDVRNNDDFKIFLFKINSIYCCVHETQINNLPTVQQLTSNQ